MPGRGAGELLSASVGLSFWGGVDAVSGTVIDRHHPLCGESVAGKVLALPGFLNPNPSPSPSPNPNQVLAIPNGRGSCTGSQVVLELLLAGQAPAAILLRRPDQIIALGVIVAEELFGRSMPVVSLGEAGFARLVGRSGATASVDGARVHLQAGDHTLPPSPSSSPLPLSLLGATTEAADANAAAGATNAEAGAAAAPAAEAAAKAAAEAHAGLTLSAADQAMLDGAHGRAAQVAMKIVARVAALQHATELVDITQAHIDGCIYVGPASLRFAQQMLALGGATSLKPPYYTSLPHTLTTPPYYTPLPHPLITPPYYPLTRWRRARADDAQCDLGRPAEMARARGAHVAR